MIDKNDPNQNFQNHQDDPRVTAYVLGELPADEAQEFEQALQQSPKLEAAVTNFRSTIQSLEIAFGEEPPMSLSDQQKSEIDSAVVNKNEFVSKAPGAQRASARPWLRWIMAAAIGGILIGGGFFLNGQRREIAQNGWTFHTPSPITGKDGIAQASPAPASDSITNEEFKTLAPLIESTIKADRWDDSELPTDQQRMLSESAPQDLGGEYQSSAGVVGQFQMNEQSNARGTLELERFSRAQQLGALEPSMPGEAMARNGDDFGVVPRSQAPAEGMSGESLEDDDKERSESMWIAGGGGGGDRQGGRRGETESGISEAGGANADFQAKTSNALQRTRMKLSESRNALSESQKELEQLRQKSSDKERELRNRMSSMPQGDQAAPEEIQPYAANLSLIVEQRQELEGKLAMSDSTELSVESFSYHEGSTTRSPATDDFIDKLSRRAKFPSARLTGDWDDGRKGKNKPTMLRKLLAANESTRSGDGESDEEMEKLDEAKSNKKSKLQRSKEDFKKQEAPKTWKRVKAIPNTTRLMVGDKEELALTGMQVNVQVDGFRARVLIDYMYYNDRDRQLEGNFKLRLPDDSSLYYFAFGESANDLTPQNRLAGREFIRGGTQFVSFTPAAITKSRTDVWRNVKEARMVPREQAAYAFRETVRKRVDPALVEWSGAGVFNAKVFPLAPKKVHRIVIGYDVNLTKTGDQLTYQLDLPESTGDCQIEINAQDIEGIAYKIEPAAEPVEVAHNDQLHQRFTFEQRPEEGIRLTATTSAPLLLKSKELDDEFWATQITPELPVENAAGSKRALFLVDTSLSSSPDKLNVWLKLLESTLANNRDSMKEFGVLFFSVDGHFWKPNYVANTPENLQQLKTSLSSLVLEGATDLYGAIETATTTDWVVEGSSTPDLFLLSDGAVNWGETNLRLIDQLLQSEKTGSLFAYQTGLTGTAISNLRFLAGQTGGAVFSVGTEQEIETASTAHRKRPWELTSISASGASDFMTAGRAQWVYPGQTLTVVGRGKIDGAMKLEFQQADSEKTIESTPIEIVSEMAARLYGQISVGQLESMGSEVFDISAAYARHFRVTGQTCSLLMLESEADYERFDIKPQEDEFVIKSKPASKLVANLLKKAADRLADPKAQLLAWLTRLETMQGLSFKMPTALKLVIDDVRVVAISEPLDCTLTTQDAVSKGYLTALQQENLDYDVIAGQAQKRRRTSIDDSIKVYSSLIERNPGDVTIARDVAFTAMELERPAQAYHLLRSVVRARPFQGSVYPAIGQCLADLDQPDMAIVYYEVALAGEFQRQGSRFKEIVSVDYMHLLREIVAGRTKSSVTDFAKARLETLSKKMPFTTADVLVTMMWNQDQTDVDLHVTEPSGEECFYKHKKTKSGGQITDDITTGFGPEMYFNQDAPQGKYKIAAKFFGSGQNRSSLKNKVYLTVFNGFGTDQEKVTRKTIQLKDAGEHRTVMEIEN